MIEAGICVEFKRELWLGLHDLEADQIKLALYTEAADLNLDTLVYTTDGEVAVNDYTAGGVVLQNVTVSKDLDEAIVDADDIVISGTDMQVRAALLYNASKGDRAIAVIDFGPSTRPDNDPEITFPSATAGTALLRI